MSATITWSIQWMNVSTQQIDGFSEVVLTAGWICTGSESTFTASAYGTCSFPLPQTGGQFTPYNQLTQAEVLGWCWANGVNQQATEAAVQTQLNDQINPPIIQPPLPWAN